MSKRWSRARAFNFFFSNELKSLSVQAIQLNVINITYKAALCVAQQHTHKAHSVCGHKLLELGYTHTEGTMSLCLTARFIINYSCVRARLYKAALLQAVLLHLTCA